MGVAQRNPTASYCYKYQFWDSLISLENRELLRQAIALRDSFMLQQETTTSDRDFAQRVLAIVTHLFHNLDNLGKRKD
ncbi:MAG: hypothetical protein F6K41_40860 [Symploca sp. SIO3E6]|nr:hypothetical protein [Caldora sp. SIO3E6]